MKLYVLDVGVYARAPLLPNLAQLTSDGDCIVTRAVLQVFRHRLQDGVHHLLENYHDVKRAILALLPRHSRKQSVQQILKLLESIRQGMKDSLVYTTLRAVLVSPLPRRSVGYLLEKLLVSVESTRHIIGLLDTLYFWLRSTSSGGPLHPFVASMEHALSNYLENSLGCRLNTGMDYVVLAPKATRLARKLQLEDVEDVTVLLSLCSLYEDFPDATYKILITVDHKMENTFRRLLGHTHCLINTSIRVIQASEAPSSES